MLHSSGIGNVITTEIRITYRTSILQLIKAVHHKLFLCIKRYRQNCNLGNLHKIGSEQGRIVVDETVFYKLLDVK